ncbi:MAG: ComF family protein [Lachnospiraceae bacterium]|nr:ComF family protein [Candidatus Minthocola equi]
MEKIRILDYFFPRRCPYCHEPTKPFHAPICKGHAELFSYVKYPVCKKCGKEISDDHAGLCYDCAQNDKPFISNIALMNYDDAAQESMVMFKYHGCREYAEFYADEIIRQHGEKLKGMNLSLILPVPVHKSKKRSRGYNQAMEIAVRIGSALAVPVRDDILIRTKKTEAQKTLSAGERAMNILDSMQVLRDLKGIGPILIVDDIYTTGSTLSACTRALISAGAQQVYGCTVCIGRDS